LRNQQHNFHFIARNEVFRKMFGNEELNKEGHLEISDISVNAFAWFLKYLYTGIVKDESKEDKDQEEEGFLQLLPEIAYIADKV